MARPLTKGTVTVEIDAGAEFSIGSSLFGGSVLSGWALLSSVAGGIAVSVGVV